MPLTYPIATSAKAALASKAHARTQGDAQRSIGSAVTLVSDWLRPTAAEYKKIAGKVEDGLRDGYVQVYEAKGGKPVLAVTYWKRQEAEKSGSDHSQPGERAAAEDHTDDLYFSKIHKARPASRRRSRAVDPRQMDLFVGPVQASREAPDALNPKSDPLEGEGARGAPGAGQDSTKTRK